MLEKIVNSRFRECYLRKTLENGFKITVIPKSFPTSYAMLCCDFGGADTGFIRDGQRYSLPAGTAHFLEHKMFENADGSDSFALYDRYGGNANAYTGYDNTCYYFSCTESFFENLEILLSSTSSLHVTKASVEREKKIIAREISMYEDSPSSILNRELMCSLYHAHPAREPLAGTAETLASIDKSVLQLAYDSFYIPPNLSLTVCGDVDAERVVGMAEKYFGAKKGARPKTLYGNEPLSVAREYHTVYGAVATPLYAVGIKCPPPGDGIEAQRKATALRLALSLTFGRASDFFCNNYATSLLNERFFAGYLQAKGSAHLLITGSGASADEVRERAVREIEEKKRSFFTEREVMREKKAAYAESIALFDSAEDTVSAFAPNAFLGFDEYDCIELITDITAEEIHGALCEIDTDNISTVIIEKKGN